MAEEKPKKAEKPKVDVKSKKHYFPKLILIFGILATALSIVSYFKYLVIPRIYLEIVILLAGLWFVKIGIQKGFYAKRKEIFKKFI